MPVEERVCTCLLRLRMLEKTKSQFMNQSEWMYMYFHHCYLCTYVITSGLIEDAVLMCLCSGILLQQMFIPFTSQSCWLWIYAGLFISQELNCVQLQLLEQMSFVCLCLQNIDICLLKKQAKNSSQKVYCMKIITGISDLW